MRSRSSLPYCPLLLIIFLSPVTLAQKASDRGIFDADRYLSHVKFLASDELEGRRPFTPGIEKAAAYIAQQFEAAGLAPAGDDGTWFQTLSLEYGKKLVESEARLTFDGHPRALEVRKDWIPLPFTKMVDVEGPLAFAGYGIAADLHEYNDYTGFDAEGKVLLIFRYEPQSDDPNADFGGSTLSHYAEFYEKAHTAARQGAKALVIVNPPTPRAGQPEGLFPFRRNYTNRTYELTLAHVTPAVAEAILKRAGLGSLKELETRLKPGQKPLSADLNVRVTLKPGVQPNQQQTRNVIGRLAGDGNTSDTIVIGGHYDHLGLTRNQFRDSDDQERIHNGADDNASGTAGVIELARVLGQERGLRRNVLFVAFTAEEMGLLGSKYFVENPTVPLEDIRAVINFDMIGRLRPDRFMVFGVSSGLEFDDIVRRAAEDAGLEYRAPEAQTGNSDHAPFMNKRIPYLFPFTGVHKDYHRPSDDWDKIDQAGAVQILTMMRPVVHELANLETGPTFQSVDVEPDPEDFPTKPAAEHEKDEDGAAAKSAGASHPGGAHDDGVDREVGRSQRPKVRFGFIPDFVPGSKPGVGIDTVLDGGPAKKAGMKAGDRILRIDEYEITDIYAYMAALKKFKAGTELNVVVVRDGKELQFKVQLEGQRRRTSEK